MVAIAAKSAEGRRRLVQLAKDHLRCVPADPAAAAGAASAVDTGMEEDIPDDGRYFYDKVSAFQAVPGLS